MSSNNNYILTLSCDDVKGIVAAVTGFLAEHGGYIIESGQFGDFATGRFFMRCEFSMPSSNKQHDIEKLFKQHVANRFGMAWQLCPAEAKIRMVVFVSKLGHCLTDLLYRCKTGILPAEIVAVIGNHDVWQEHVAWHGIPYYTLEVNKENKRQQEENALEIINKHQADLVVLARYMQILSPFMVSKLYGKAINIHHSFLPSFKGGKPYHQAYERGVKIIGATAHYVTNELDEGPIIEQEVLRVNHANSPNKLMEIGQDIERRVLARAVQYHIEHRILINGTKTVVFN